MADEAIRSFFGDHRFLSNFWQEPFDVAVNGRMVRVPTAEHAYQAMKAAAAHDAEAILAARRPGEAKRMARRVPMRTDWDEIRVAVMRHVLEAKFSANSTLARRLLATRDAELVEGNTWGDDFWGVSTEGGLNWLGYLLMARRSELRWRESRQREALA